MVKLMIHPITLGYLMSSFYYPSDKVTKFMYMQSLIHELVMKASLLTVGMTHQCDAVSNIHVRHFGTTIASTMHQAHQVTQRRLQHYLPVPWGHCRRLISWHSTGNGHMHSLMRLRSFLSCHKKLLICVIPFNGGRDSRHSSPTSLAIPGVSTHI